MKSSLHRIFSWLARSRFYRGTDDHVKEPLFSAAGTTGENVNVFIPTGANRKELLSHNSLIWLYH
jgi:hypothetical protein